MEPCEPMPAGQPLVVPAAAAAAAATDVPPSVLYDWSTYKPVLRRLYLEQARTLKDVMQIMEQNHQLSATTNMYKKKFRQWGWTKNNKRDRASIGSSANVTQKRRPPTFSGQSKPLNLASSSSKLDQGTDAHPSADILVDRIDTADPSNAHLEPFKRHHPMFDSISHASSPGKRILVPPRRGPYYTSPAQSKGSTTIPEGKGFDAPVWTSHTTSNNSPNLLDWTECSGYGLISSSSTSPSTSYAVFTAPRSGPSWSLQRSSIGHGNLPRPIEDPTVLKLPKIAAWAVNEHVRRCLVPLLPKHHVPATVPSAFCANKMDGDMQLRSPECIMVLGNCMFSGMQAVATGRASTCGAFFEKGFRQVEAVVRTNFINMIIPVLSIYRESQHCGQIQIGQMLISQLGRMATKLHGRDSIHALWTSSILRMPESMINDLVVVLATSYQDAMSNLLGRYNFHTMQTRTFVLQIKSTIDPARTAPEWDQLIADYRSLPRSADVDRLIRDALMYYGESLVKILGDHARAELVLQDYVGWLEAATPELGYGYWSMVAGVELYARSLAGQAKDDAAESTYRFLIRRTMELVGVDQKDHVLLLECKRSFAAFLTDRGRLQEMDHIYGEIDAELAAYMLEQKL